MEAPKNPKPMKLLSLDKPIAGLEEEYQRDRQRFSRPEAELVLGPSGRMVWYSKSDYYERFPERAPVWNANLCTREEGKVWFGDCDVHTDEDALLELARRLGKTVYVLSEYDGRFRGRDEQPLIDRAIYAVSPDGTVTLDERRVVRGEDGRLHRASWRSR